MSTPQAKIKEIIIIASIKKIRDEISDVSGKIDENSQNIGTLDEKIGEIDEKLTKKVENIQLQKGDDGYSPVKGVDYFDGEKGDNYILTPEDKQEIAKAIEVPIVEKITERIEVIKEQPIVTNEIKEVAVYDNAEDIRDKLETLVGDERLTKESIKGLDEELKQAKEVRVIGGRNGLYTYIDGVKKGLIQNIDFNAGSGIAISYSKVNGLDTITFETSGSGITVETPVEVPNAVITVFTVSAEPKWMVADGITLYDGAGYTYSVLSVTFDLAPSATVRAII